MPRRPGADDGNSISSDLKVDLKGLTLHGKSVASNKRVAADLVPGPDLGRPAKRGGSFDGTVGRGPASHPSRPVHYDAAHDQRPLDLRTPALPVSVGQDLPDERTHPDSYGSPTSPHRTGGLLPANSIPQLYPAAQIGSNPTANPEAEGLMSTSPSTPPAFDTSPHNGLAMLRQPETRPITQEQLVNEVKGIYAGLVMVEKKCVEVIRVDSPSYLHSLPTFIL